MQPKEIHSFSIVDVRLVVNMSRCWLEILFYKERQKNDKQKDMDYC